jgi:hypothetical protein
MGIELAGERERAAQRGAALPGQHEHGIFEELAQMTRDGTYQLGEGEANEGQNAGWVLPSDVVLRSCGTALYAAPSHSVGIISDYRRYAT